MLRLIKFYGKIAEKYGAEFRLAVETPAEALRALCSQIKGLHNDLRDGEWLCVRGDYETGVACDEPLLRLGLGGLAEFHVIPAAIGRKSGIGKILIGLVLVAATVITAGAALAPIFAAGMGGDLTLTSFLAAGLGGFGLYGAAIGGLLILGGISQMISPSPSSASSADNSTGYLFNGAANTSTQGGACPLVFGRITAGSAVVSAGITSERLGAAQTDFTPGSGNLSYTTMPIFSY